MKDSLDQLPEDLHALLDGNALADKLGFTVLISTSGSDGWPHLAQLSVGEVLAVSATEIRLALYGSSGTSTALLSTGRGLLTAVVNRVTYKVRTEMSPIGGSRSGLQFFQGQVVRCDLDVVDYAQVIHGFEFDVDSEEEVVMRWIRQVEALREAVS